MQLAILVMLVVGVIIMEWPMNPRATKNKKKEKNNGSKGTDGDS